MVFEWAFRSSIARRGFASVEAKREGGCGCLVHSGDCIGEGKRERIK